MSSSLAEEEEEEEEEEDERRLVSIGRSGVGDPKDAARLVESTAVGASRRRFSHQCLARLRMRRKMALNTVPPDPTIASLTDLDQILISFCCEIYDLAIMDWAIVAQ